MRYYPAAKKGKLDSVWVDPSLVVSIVGWAVGIQKFPDASILLVHCQDVIKVPQPSAVRSWITTPSPVSAPPVPVLGTSTVAHTFQGSPSIDVLPLDEGVVLADVDSAGVYSASHDAQIGCGPYSAVNNCPCIQLPYGCFARWY